MFGQSNQSLLNDDIQLVVKLIPVLTSEGAQAPLSKPIVGCGYSEISFHFCEDCRIFCEGVKDSTIGIVSNNGIVGRINHNGFIGLGVSFIDHGFVGFIGLCLVSIAGLIGHISLVSLGGFSGISGLVGRISLVSLIGLIGLIGLVSLGKLGITSLVGLLASSACRLISLTSFTIRSLATIAAAAILSVVVASQAAEATILTSATKIANMAFYYFASSSLHVCLRVREKMCWWLTLARKKMWQWIASFGESYHSDVLQFAKQLFSVRLPLMTEFFVMRDCDKILSGYLCTVTTVFSQQDGIYGFKFLKRFLEISCRDEMSLFLLFSLFILTKAS